MSLLRRSYPFLLILLFAIVAYWQLVFNQGILRWDGPHCFLAWRYDVTELIRSGSLPLWSSYQHLGFPLYADPETGAWYPIIWLMALIRGYDFYSLHFEWILHIFIAGSGLFTLARAMGVSSTLALIGAICFSGCGVFVSNAQNFGFLIGLAWAPWLVHYFRQALITSRIRFVVLFAFVSWFLFTGSYPAITVMLAYSLVIGGAYFFYTTTERFTSKKLVWEKVRTIVYIMVLTIGLCAVHLASITECLSQMTRIDGLAQSRLLENSLTPQALISFVTPYAAATSNGFEWGCDTAMINCYVGIIPLFVIALWFFSKGKTRVEWLLFGSFLFLLMAAMGHTFPLRTWLSYLPGLGLFRHPSLFRFPALMVMILFTVVSFHRLWNTATAKRIVITGGTMILLVLLFSLSQVSFLKPFPYGLFSSFKNISDQSFLSVQERIFYQGLVQVLFLLLIVFALSTARKKMALVVVFVEMTFSIQLNIYSTILYPMSFDKAQKRLETVEKGPRNYLGQHINTISSENDTLGIEVLIENENIFLRQPAWDGYNSYILEGYDRLEHRDSMSRLLDHPIIYFENGNFADRYELGKNSVVSFSETECSGRCILLQNYLPQWCCYADAKKLKVEVYDDSFCSAEIPMGTKRVEFVYESRWAVISGLVTLVTFLVCLVLLFAQWKRSKRDRILQ